MKYRGNKFSIVCALAKNSRGIGIENKLPWKLKEDMEYFRQLTTFTDTDTLYPNVVIMGRNTWTSLPKKFKPLPDRQNIIVSNTYGIQPEYSQWKVKKSLTDALQYPSNWQKIFVIGGAKLYEEAINHPGCEKLYLTEVEVDNDNADNYDTFFPKISKEYVLTKKTEGKTKSVYFLEYDRWTDPESDEIGYLNLLREIKNHGNEKDDRTGTGTLSLFGKQLRFDISEKFPLLTTKRMYFKGIVEELLFFLRGDHDNRKLQEKDVHIWDGNTSKEYLEKYNKQHIGENDLGLAYGVQWRAAGAKLENIDTNYVGKGIDQVAEALDAIKNNPDSRRIIINGWNVPQLKDMALPPCHMLYQFYVHNGKLSCSMTQRSADTFLGIPFNIASCATMVYLFSKATNLQPGELILNLGDAHIYKNHLEQVERQLQRTPLKFPKLEIPKDISSIEDIEQLSYKDFELIDYHYHPGIKAKMAV